MGERGAPRADVGEDEHERRGARWMTLDGLVCGGLCGDDVCHRRRRPPSIAMQRRVWLRAQVKHAALEDGRGRAMNGVGEMCGAASGRQVLARIDACGHWLCHTDVCTVCAGDLCASFDFTRLGRGSDGLGCGRCAALGRRGRRSGRGTRAGRAHPSHNSQKHIYYPSTTIHLS